VRGQQVDQFKPLARCGHQAGVQQAGVHQAVKMPPGKPGSPVPSTVEIVPSGVKVVRKNASV
jgi:hypothetical protein